MTEFDQLIDHLGLGALPECSALGQLAALRTLRKHTRFCAAGDTLFFLLSGVLRSYTIDQSDRDITDRFVCRYGQLCVSSSDEALSPAPTARVEALTDATLLCFDIGALKQQFRCCLPLCSFYNRLLLEAFAEHWQHKNTLYRADAMARYHWFLETYPGLIDQVPHKHIASFLDMTPVTLSRLRRTEKDNR